MIKYFTNAILIAIAITITSSLIASQSESVILCFGSVTYKEENVSGVSIKVFHNKKLVEELVTNRRGGYGFALDFNKNYEIELVKEGFLKEVILINTAASPDVIAYSDQFLWEPELKIYKYIPGLPFDEFGTPLASYEFNHTLWRFIESERYKTSVARKITPILKKIQKQEQIAYNELEGEADALLKTGKYEEAILAYSEALSYNTENKYPTEKIKEAKKLLKAQHSNDAGYQEAIQSADQYLMMKNYAEANNYYQKALIYKPKDEYPLLKLFEIDSIQTYKWIELNRQYEAMLTAGESFYNAGNYLASKNSYREASRLFPEKSYPKEMIELADNAIKYNPISAREEESFTDSNKTYSPGDANNANADIPNLSERKNEPWRNGLRESKPEDDTKSSLKSDDKLSSVDDSMNREESIKKLEIKLQETIESGDKQASSTILEEMGSIYSNDYKLGDALNSYNSSLDLKRELDDKEGEAEVLGHIASVLYDSGSYNSSIQSFEYSLAITEELNNKEQSAKLLENIALVYENTYRYDDALKYLNKSLEIKEELGDNSGRSEIHKNKGNIYYEQSDFDLAINELEKALEIDEAEQNEDEIGGTLNSLGSAFYAKEEFEKAEELYEKSLEQSVKRENLRDQSILLNNIGNINFNLSKYEKAIDYYEQSLKIKSELSFKEGMATTLHNIGNAFFAQKEYSKSLEYYLSSQELAEESNFREVVWKNYEAFAKTYASLGNYKQAFENYRNYTRSKYEFDSQEKQLVELREQYESSKIAVKNLRSELKKQNRIARYEAERNTREMQIIQLEVTNKQQQLNKQRIIIISFIIGSLFILLFLLIITRQYRQKNKAFNIVAYQKKHITDGIAYASRIQNAVLPPQKHIESVIPNQFIINRPREIVGGDFYWVATHHDKTVIAVSDCTGHGVPGGFMSMLGVAILNEIISTEKILEAHDILSQLRDRVVEALHQRHELSETLDGMDISIVILDLKTKEIQFSAAYHSLYLIRDAQFEKVKGDRVPIGFHRIARSFTSKKFQLKTGDMMYLTTDGYIDQLGELTNSRFMNSQFINTLQLIWNLPLAEQKNRLENTLEEWKGKIDQTDDILVMGIRV